MKLDELQWHKDGQHFREARAGHYRVFQCVRDIQGHRVGEYVVTSDVLEIRYEHLDAISLQAILYHLLSNDQPESEGEKDV